jgi:hypothetical protein
MSPTGLGLVGFFVAPTTARASGLKTHGTSLRDLCAGGDLGGVRTFFSSSGSTGTFSFGVGNLARRRAVGP